MTPTATHPAARIRVLVVDDSVVIRRLVSDVLTRDPEVEVVGTAANGRLALAKINLLQPDIVTLDVEMPEMDGIATLRVLRVDHPRLPVIMFSTLTERGARTTLDALAAGATDYVNKPANVGSVTESMAAVGAELLPKIRALTGRRIRPAAPAGPASGPPSGPAAGGGAVATAPAARFVAHPAGRTSPPVTAPRLLAIGCSTGGPQALTAVLQALPAAFPLPVVVVQHMPPLFTAQFAARLDRICAVHVVESAGRERLAPGTVYIAPGDYHLEVRPDGAELATRLHQGPQVSFCRPSVDVLFASVAAAVGGAVLAAVLTGMGTDGRDGAGKIVARGGRVLVQDEESSVVWGMPGAIAAAGLADAVLPLDQIGPTITTLAAPRTAPSSVGGGAR